MIRLQGLRRNGKREKVPRRGGGSRIFEKKGKSSQVVLTPPEKKCHRKRYILRS